jgi:hypothetical protein
MIMAKFDQRGTVTRRLSCVIMPHVMAELNAKSFDLKYEIQRNGGDRQRYQGDSGHSQSNLRISHI